MNSNGTFFIVDPLVEIKIGDKVFIHMDDEDTYTGTVTAPGEFMLDEFMGLSIGSFAPGRWKFGTILRPKDDHGNTRRLMVVLDNGVPSFSAVMIASATTREIGDLRHNYARNRWEPES